MCIYGEKYNSSLSPFCGRLRNKCYDSLIVHLCMWTVKHKNKKNPPKKLFSYEPMCNLSYEHSSGMQIIHFQQKKGRHAWDSMHIYHKYEEVSHKE
jgi:hypothetical protein